MKSRLLFAIFATLAVTASPALGQTQPSPTQPRTASVNTGPRVDVATMPRPIDMHDSVWIEDLTMLEVRDLLKAGKTTAVILTGGIEENGPYLTTGKHNNVLRAQGESIARALGTALVAPIVTLEPGTPSRPNLSPGTVVLSQATYRAVLTDMATSLRSQGFTDIVLLGDSGGNLKGMQEVATTLNAEWKGQGYVHFIPEVLQLRRGREVRRGTARHPREARGIPRRLLHHLNHRDRGHRWHPHAGAPQGGEVHDQRRSARPDREDHLQRTADRAVPD